MHTRRRDLKGCGLILLLALAGCQTDGKNEGIRHSLLVPGITSGVPQTKEAAVPPASVPAAETKPQPQPSAPATEDQAAGPQNPNSKDGPRISRESYSLFYDQGDHFSELMAAGKYDDAAVLYNEQAAYFAEERRKARYAPQLAALAEHHRSVWLPVLKAAQGKLDSMSRANSVPAAADWLRLRGDLKQIEQALALKDDLLLLRRTDAYPAEATALAAGLAEIKEKWRRSAPGAFASYDHTSGASFFDSYPLPLDPNAFMSAQASEIAVALSEASTDQIRGFVQLYAEHEPSLRKGAADLFMARYLKENGAPTPVDLMSAIRAYTAAREAGLEPASLNGLRVGFVQATSKTLLLQKQIEFSAAVDLDLPISADMLDLDKALADGGDAPEILIIFDVAAAKASRRVVNRKTEGSRYIAGTRTVPNPAYHAAQIELQKRQMDLQSARSSGLSSQIQSHTCFGMGCLGAALGNLAAAIAETKAKSDANDLLDQLKTTPATLEEPIYESYSFDRAEVRGTKAMTVHYYIIDRRRREYFKSTFDAIDRRSFSVVYNLHQQDPKASELLNTGDKDQDVAEWEVAPFPIKLSDLMRQFVAQPGNRATYASATALRQTMLADKNVALAKAEATRFEATPGNDSRFESVVVVLPQGGGGMGSGFFVAPDLVLTNWHVVEDQTFVEMRTFDKQETFGKVIAKDIRLDLALIKVQTRGRPVRFYEGQTVELGRTVEAVGHPKGLHFSITRGVISAVRPHRGINLVGNRTGKEILFIQTDTPINPGNSGGPLFLGDRVVGVNTWGLSAQIAEGLSFAVHYSEVQAFLAETLGGATLRN